MLVKLGDVWVDPAKVVFLESSPVNADTDDSIADRICIMTDKGSSRTLGNIDEFASIVNNAVSQSFGGQVEETPAEE